MKALRVAGTLLVFGCLLSLQLFSQSSNARLNGTVNDASGAVLPGVQDFAADGVPVFTYTGVYHESTEGQTLRV